MNQILKEIQQIENWKNLYDSFASKNNLKSINSKLINQQNFQNFQNFIETIVEKGPRKSKKRWVSNQRRILYVIVNCLSAILRLTVQQFKTQEIQRLSRVFSYKDNHSIQYELKKLSSNSRQNRRRWQQKEQNLLEDVVKQVQNKFRKSANKNKWNEIARQLYIASKGQYFRQGKHCRQRFYKLKSGKGSQQNSEEMQPYPQISNENSLKFHSHNSFNQSNQMDVEDNVNINEKSQNSDHRKDKNQPIYIKNLIVSNEKGSLGKKYTEKNNLDRKLSQINIKTSESIEKQQEIQQQNLLDLSQNMKEVQEKLQCSKSKYIQKQSMLEQIKQSPLDNFKTSILENFQNKDQENISQSGLMFQPTIHEVHVINFLTANTFFHNLCPVIFPIWPGSIYQYNFQDYSQE